MLLRATRVWLPLALVAAGIVMMVMGHGNYTSLLANRDSLLSGLGMGLVLVAACVAMVNWMIRLTTSSDKDREREEWARDYFTRTGRWPGEGGTPGDEF
jgi:TRAP-type C4-dicarboxylate transport system permease small subunit